MEPVKIEHIKNIIHKFTVRCPHCGEISEFALIRLGAKLTVFGIPVRRLHNRREAVCGNCAAVFRLSEDKILKTKFGKLARISASELEER